MPSVLEITTVANTSSISEQEALIQNLTSALTSTASTWSTLGNRHGGYGCDACTGKCVFSIGRSGGAIRVTAVFASECRKCPSKTILCSGPQDILLRAMAAAESRYVHLVHLGV